MQDDTGTSYSDKINYFDGLGRPVETVLREASPLTERYPLPAGIRRRGQGKQCLASRARRQRYGSIHGADLIQTGGDGLLFRQCPPYSHPVYEPSPPLNRVTERYAPGEAWRMAERPVKRII